MGLNERIDVDIDELVFDGVALVDRDRVAAAFEHELTRLLAQHGTQVDGRGLLAAEADRAVDVVSGPRPLPRSSSSRRLGQALARAVYDGFTRADPQAGEAR